jgi:hypothetical protein
VALLNVSQFLTFVWPTHAHYGRVWVLSIVVRLFSPVDEFPTPLLGQNPPNLELSERFPPLNFDGPETKKHRKQPGKWLSRAQKSENFDTKISFFSCKFQDFFQNIGEKSFSESGKPILGVLLTMGRSSHGYWTKFSVFFRQTGIFL